MARRLLKEAGAEGFSFTLTNRGVPQPYEPVGIWLIDQWRQVGLNVKQVTLETAAWLQAQKSGEHEVSTNAPCNSIVEPDMDLHWFLTTSPVNFSRHKDRVMDELYQKQSRATMWTPRCWRTRRNPANPRWIRGSTFPRKRLDAWRATRAEW